MNNKGLLGLKLIEKNADKAIDFLNKELSMPNIPTPTMGGEFFWNDLAEFKGWRLQQNMLSKHARILDPNNVRRAWGTVNGMYAALDRLVESMENTRYKKSTSPEDSQVASERLLRLKQLLDAGAITKEEYEEKKAELIDFI